MQEFVSNLVADDSRWDCAATARQVYGDRLVDFALRLAKFIIWNFDEGDMAFHAQWTVSISIPRLSQPMLERRILDFAHEIGHLIPQGWPMRLNAYFYIRGYVFGNRWFSRLNLLTEIPACLIGYCVLIRCGIWPVHWRWHLWSTIKHYWICSRHRECCGRVVEDGTVVALGTINAWKDLLNAILGDAWRIIV